MRNNTASLLGRIFSKILHDILPAALASLVGGFVLTHYGAGRVVETQAVSVSPASGEMMQLLSDEHALVVDYLKAQLANEKKQLVADEIETREAAESRAVAEAKVETRAAPVSVRTTIAAAATPPAAKAGALHGRNSNAAAQSPLVVAQAQPGGQAQPMDAGAPAPRPPDSFFARTIGLTDHVIAVTHRAVVSAIGGIPSWFGSIGDRIGGEDPTPRPPAELVRTS